MPSKDLPARVLRGHWGQAFARKILVERGFEILVENFRPGPRFKGAGEIDFFCRRGSGYHVFEVKAHRPFEGQVLLSDRQRGRLHQSQKVLREEFDVPGCQKIFTWLLWINWADRRVEFVENP